MECGFQLAQYQPIKPPRTPPNPQVRHPEATTRRKAKFFHAIDTRQQAQSGFESGVFLAHRQQEELQNSILDRHQSFRMPKFTLLSKKNLYVTSVFLHRSNTVKLMYTNVLCNVILEVKLRMLRCIGIMLLKR